MRRPIYLDGPLKGQDRPISDGLRCIAAIDPEIRLDNKASGSYANDTVVYQFKRYGLMSGGTTFYVWLGWCSPFAEPSAEIIMNAILNPTALERGYFGRENWDPIDYS